MSKWTRHDRPHGHDPKKHGPNTTQQNNALGRSVTTVGQDLGRILSTLARHGHVTILGYPTRLDDQLVVHI
jgi:hypothetical protein